MEGSEKLTTFITFLSGKGLLTDWLEHVITADFHEVMSGRMVDRCLYWEDCDSGDRVWADVHEEWRRLWRETEWGNV